MKLIINPLVINNVHSFTPRKVGVKKIQLVSVTPEVVGVTPVTSKVVNVTPEVVSVIPEVVGVTPVTSKVVSVTPKVVSVIPVTSKVVNVTPKVANVTPITSKVVSVTSTVHTTTSSGLPKPAIRLCKLCNLAVVYDCTVCTDKKYCDDCCYKRRHKT